MWPNSETLENGFVKVLLVVIHGHGACDQYLFNLHEKLIKTDKAVYQSSGRVIIESSVYCVNRDYTAKSHL